MQPKALNTEERAVSPVVGVVLMVAVTVILAAIVAAFALGIGSSADSTPQASFEYNYDGTDVTSVHEGGDPLDPSRVTVLKNGNTTGATWSGSGDITTGDRASVAAASGDEIRIVWQGDNGKTSTISEYTVP